MADPGRVAGPGCGAEESSSSIGASWSEKGVATAVQLVRGCLPGRVFFAAVPSESGDEGTPPETESRARFP